MRDKVSKQAQTWLEAPAEPRLLTPGAVAYVAAHPALFIGLPYLWLRMLDLFFLSPNQDMHRYFNAAGQWLTGMTPYKDFLLEYPPGSLFAFVLPRFLSDDFNIFSQLFAAQMLLVDLGIIWLCMQVAHLVQRLPTVASATPCTASGNAAGAAYSHRTVGAYDRIVAALGYVALSGALGYLAFERYDLTFTALILGWVACTLSDRPRFWADLMLALGIWVKLLSAMLVPLYLIYLCAQECDLSGQSWRAGARRALRWLGRQGLMRLAGIGGLTVGLALPFYLRAPDQFFVFIKYHHDRGIQLESTYANLLLIAHDLFGTKIRAQHVYGAMELAHPWAKWLAQISVGVTLSALGAATLWFGKKMVQAAGPRARAHLLIEGACTLLLLFMACNKVFSPQYLLWTAPLAGLCILREPQKTRRWLFGFAVLYGVTGLILFFYYINIIWMHRYATALLTLRNAMVFAMAWTLCDVPVKGRLKPGIDRVFGAVRRLVTQPVWSRMAFMLCAIWVFCANLSETTANDIWIQLRSGRDIVASRTMPYVETYSATVSGRPFIAHEWLSGVVFHGLDWLLGDAGLSLLAAAVALGTFIIMYFAFARTTRKTLGYLPLLLLMSYLVAFRVLVRPHIFTIVAQAALMFAAERWRRGGSVLQLWWLVPMQLVWINLHGAALFGPAFVAMLAVCVAILVLFPELQTFGAEARTFVARDVYGLSAVAAAMTLACFVNPYGTRIVAFSIDLLGNDYAKNRVWEWTTPFLASNTTYYWLWLFISALILLWASVAVRLRQLPLIDLSYAILVTYLSTRANRFVPDFAIFAFPVIVRALTKLSHLGLRPAHRRQQPWFEMGLATLLITNCVVYGYAHSAREHRPLIGWGYGGDMPYQEVELIKRLGLRGVIFNEYSDGALIIHELVPQVRPVLDSRIDLYPLDQVEEYDRAYAVPQLFERYADRHNVNIVMLYERRAVPRVMAYLDNSPAWRRLSRTNGRILWVRRTTALAAGPT